MIDRRSMPARGLAGALVTGASSGIGEAITRSLASSGVPVMMLARRGDRLRQIAAEIAADGGTALVLEGDVTSRNEAVAAVEQAASTFGGLDVVVNNAGVMLNGPVETADVADWETMISVNILGALYISHAALPYLLKSASEGPRQVADLVNISSIAGRFVRRGSGIYNLTKHGLGAFSESLRQEVAARHVRVSLVEPGVVRSELQSHQRPEIQELSRRRFAAVERLDPDDVADAVMYVISRRRHVAVNEIMLRPTEQDS